jgi:TonB family protein
MKSSIPGWIAIALLVAGCHKKPPTPSQDVRPSSGQGGQPTPDQEVRPCYAPELAQNPGLQGDVVIIFDVAASGQINSARVASTSLRNTNVELCTIDVVNRWKITNPKGAVLKSRVSFHFSPSRITTGP